MLLQRMLALSKLSSRRERERTLRSRCLYGALDGKSANASSTSLSASPTAPLFPAVGASKASPSRRGRALGSHSAVRLLPAIDYCPSSAGGSLCVRGRTAKKFKRSAPMLWLSLRLHWKGSTAAQRGALKQVLEKTATPPRGGRAAAGGAEADQEAPRTRDEHPGGAARAEVVGMTAQAYHVACDFCTLVNRVDASVGAGLCVMCGAALPISDVSFDERLPCGLTMRQLEDLQTRELSAEDFEALLLLDDSVAKKTLDRASVDRFPSIVVTEAGTDCGVCQCALEVDETMTQLPCGHSFHRECISKWLLEYSVTCPFKCSIALS